MRIFELRVYTLRTKEVLDFYAGATMQAHNDHFHYTPGFTRRP
jgi:hypothetical protein